MTQKENIFGPGKFIRFLSSLSSSAYTSKRPCCQRSLIKKITTPQSWNVTSCSKSPRPTPSTAIPVGSPAEAELVKLLENTFRHVNIALVNELAMFARELGVDIQRVPGIKTALFGGEGLFFVQLTGPGRVILQTLPFSRLADRIIAASPRAGGKRVGEGSILGGLGGLLDGLYLGSTGAIRAQKADVIVYSQSARDSFLRSRITDPDFVEQLGMELLRLVETEKKSKLLINFEGVQFLSSAALGKLMKLDKRIIMTGE